MPADPHEWQNRAACTYHGDPEDFFPEYRGNQQERNAKQICQTCPVRAQCLETALTHEDSYGIWGGLSQHERTQLLRARPITRSRRA